MKLGLISDTHNQVDRTIAAMKLLLDAGAEAIFHSGDFTRVEILPLCADKPLYYVFGNNDVYESEALVATGESCGATCLKWGGAVELADRRIAITHGHLSQEMRDLLADKPDYFISGHTHVAQDSRSGSTRLINPGALHRASEYSVATLDLATDELKFLEVPR